MNLEEICRRIRGCAGEKFADQESLRGLATFEVKFDKSLISTEISKGIEVRIEKI